MKQRTTALSLLTALAIVDCISGAAFAQEDTLPARPMYGHLKPNLVPGAKPPVTALKTWNGQFTFGGTIYHYNMVGTAPGSGTSTTIPVCLIPVKMVYKTSTTTVTFDAAAHKRSNGPTLQASALA